jgi:hypothetical protein
MLMPFYKNAYTKCLNKAEVTAIRMLKLQDILKANNQQSQLDQENKQT